MRRNMKFFVTLAAVLTAYCAYAQDSTAIPFTLPDGKTEEFYQNQTKSIIQYNQLLNSLKPESQNYSDHNKSIAWSRNTPVSKSNSSNQIYDDCYGGAYIDDNGNLVVLLTDNTYPTRQKIKDYTRDSLIQTKTCKYSYNEIMNVINTLNSHLDELRDCGADLNSIYSDPKNNRVIISIRNLNDYKESLVRDIIDAEFMVFQNAEEEFEMQSGTSISMQGGSTIYNTSTKKNATLGFCAIRNGKKGYVTASHFAKKVGQQISYNGTVIGTVTQTQYYNNATADAAFIESNGAAIPTGTILGGYHCTSTISLSELQYPQDVTILLYGMTSGLQQGKLLYPSFTYIPYSREEYTVVDHALADYKSVDTDSGGPIFIYTGWNNGRHTCTLIGIHTASAKVSDPGPKVFAKYENIARDLNLTAITE